MLYAFLFYALNVLNVLDVLNVLNVLSLCLYVSLFNRHRKDGISTILTMALLISHVMSQESYGSFTTLHTWWHACNPLIAYVGTYARMYIRTNMLYILTYPHAYMPTYLRAYAWKYMHACIHVIAQCEYIHIYIYVVPVGGRLPPPIVWSPRPSPARSIL